MSTASRARRGRNKPQHVLPTVPVKLAEARQKRAKTPISASRAFSLAWDQNEAMGLTADMRRSGPGMLSDQERKETLYKAYLNNVWISSCVDVIAKRITSGGYVIDEVEQDQGNQANKVLLEGLVKYVNEDDDFLQLIRAIATDLLIYGEAYLEIVKKNGKPFSLHKIDCITMNYVLDQHGHVVKYIQNMTHSTETIEFAPEDVIRWWLPDAQAHQKALSPIERILGPVDADTRMADWVRQFFRKGARPNFWIDFPGTRAEAERFIAYFRENYTGQANAHVPPVMYSGAKIQPFGQGTVDADFLKGREQMCKEILAGYQVPPALVGLIESGNIGGGTGESQEKSFQFNACDPIRFLIFEKFNYRVVRQGFGIEDWTVNTRYNDYRADDVVTKINDLRIRNGSATINEVRAETGKPPLDGGETAIFAVSREVFPVERLAAMADEQAESMQADLDTKRAAADMAQVKLDQAKNPPKLPLMSPGVPKPPGQPGGQQAPGALQGMQGVGNQAPKESANHSGVMVAFMLSDNIAQQLALPGGEPADDLHVTLAYLGDADQMTSDQIRALHSVVNRFASSHPALQGRLSGVGRFNAPPGQPEPVYASVDVPDLPAFRQALIHALSAAGLPVNQEHGFTPHITLKYAKPDEAMPVWRMPSTPLLFDRLLLAIAGQQFIFLLNGTKQEESQRLTGFVSRQGSCTCDTCKANDGKEVDRAPPFHDGCDCKLEAKESSDPKAHASSGSSPGGVLAASSTIWRTS